MPDDFGLLNHLGCLAIKGCKLKLVVFVVVILLSFNTLSKWNGAGKALNLVLLVDVWDAKVLV